MRFISIIAVCFLLVGCQPGLIDELPVEPPRLVVQAEPVEGEPWQVYLSHTYATLDSASDALNPPGVVENATVKIFDNGAFAEDLNATGSPDEMQKYVSNNGPQRGHTYTLKVDAPGYNSITATYTHPPPVSIANVVIEFTRTEIYNPNSDRPNASYDFNIDITFNDPVGENYYQFVLVRSSGPDPLNSDYAVTEFVASRKPELRNNFLGGSITDDKKFEGQTVTLPFQSFTSSEIVSDTLAIPYVTIGLKSLSKEYYEFRRYISELGPSYYDPYAQPAIVKTNVQGGLGVFAGYSKSNYTFKLKKP